MTVPESFDELVDQVIPALDAFDAWRKDVGITDHSARADHLGYQCGDSAEFERLRALVEKESTFIFQSMIAGRRIVLGRIPFPRGLHTSLGVIELIEICDQKPDGSKARGFDHLEIYPYVYAGYDIKRLVRQLNGAFRDPRYSQLPCFGESGRKHHPTYDAVIDRYGGPPGFKVRVEPEPLLAKIARDEFR